MAIQNYGQLRAQFKKNLKRKDCTDADADNFIDQGLSRVVRALRVPSMERIANLTPTATGEITIPEDFVELKALVSNLGTDDELKLEKKALGEFLALPPSQGNPRFFTRISNKWLLRPNPGVDGDITAIYYGDPTNFDSDDDTDPLIDVASDAIIFASLTFAAVVYSDARKDAFEMSYQNAIAEIDLSVMNMEANEGSTEVSPATDTPY